MKSVTPILTALLVVMQLFALAQLCRAQAYKDEKLIYLGADGQRTKERKAVVLEQQIKFDDSLYEINFYNIGGPMFKSFRANDPEGTMLNGDFRSYDAGGTMDTAGTFHDGRRDGEWSVYFRGRYTGKLMYDQGNLLWAKDTLQLKHENDSLAAGHEKDTIMIDDETVTEVEVESGFPGGTTAWLNYLQRNMRYPDDAVRNRIQGVVIVGFVVDKQGHVAANRAYVHKSVEYSLDQEALRIIFSSPSWYPAIQNGKIVSSYKKQPIVFRFQ
jgi:TonB family protein